MQNGFERNYSYVYKPFATEFLDFFRIKTSSTALICELARFPYAYFLKKL